MNQIDVIFLISAVAIALLGFLLGFGRSLKVATKGLVGVAISILVCVMLGGTVRSIDAIDAFITSIDEYLIGVWSFLGYLNLGRVVYYLCFFFAVQLLRIIIVKAISKMGDTDNKVIKAVNKILGAVFLTAFCLALCLLILSVIKLLENTDFAMNLVEKMEGSFLSTLYENNPIKL